MSRFIIIALVIFSVIPSYGSEYERNKAVPVEKVLFGKITSVRNITEKELIEDKAKGWKTFHGALLGGIIGHQFGSGNGRDVTTILGAIIGASLVDNDNPKYREKVIRLVELMIKIDNGDEYMVVQDKDPNMLFSQYDNIRMIYLTDGTVRIDKQL